MLEALRESVDRGVGGGSKDAGTHTPSIDVELCVGTTCVRDARIDAAVQAHVSGQHAARRERLKLLDALGCTASLIGRYGGSGGHRNLHGVSIGAVDVHRRASGAETHPDSDASTRGNPSIPLRAVAAVTTFLATHPERRDIGEALLVDAVHEEFDDGVPDDVAAWLAKRRRSPAPHRRGHGAAHSRRTDARPSPSDIAG